MTTEVATAKPLSAKHQRFVDEYMKDRNGTQAAIRAGYAERSAYNQADRLMRNDEVKAEINRRIAEYTRTAGIEPVRLLEVAKWGCLTDVREAFNEDGTIKNPRQWSRELAAAILAHDATGKIRFQNQPELALKLLERIQPLLAPEAVSVTQNVQVNVDKALIHLRAAIDGD